MKLTKFIEFEKSLLREALGEAMKTREYHVMSPVEKHRLVMAHYQKLIRNGQSKQD